jgi:hypothetical protein
MVPSRSACSSSWASARVVSWRKATGKNLLEAFRIPAISALTVMLLLHGLFGSSLGYPAFYDGVSPSTTP